MSKTHTDKVAWLAPAVMAVAGLLTFIGGQIHPRGELDQDFHQLEAGLLSHEKTWDMTHAVLAVAIVLLAAGLYLMLQTDRVRTDRPLHTATVIALIGALISWPEMAFHIAMTSEAGALASGGATPLFDIHVVLQAIFTPLLGWGMAAMAWRGGVTGRWGNRWIAVLGVVGGLVFGLAGPVVALHPDSHDSLLFIGDAPLGLWALAAGLQVLWVRRRDAAVQPAGQVPSPL